jgi:hypothetical protein
MLKTLTITSMLLMSGAAMAQSVGNSGNPGAANTTDPNSAPMAGSAGTRTDGRATTGAGSNMGNMGRGGLDAAGRANTSDPNSANSAGTNAAGRPANPTVNPMTR